MSKEKNKRQTKKCILSGNKRIVTRGEVGGGIAEIDDGDKRAYLS